MLYYIANLVLGFYSRKVFIDYVGIDVLGLNQTAQNLLGFLNISELGIGSAVAFTLYRPIAKKQFESINEIVLVQGWLYRHIACIIGGGAIILMAFFPLIFAEIKLPLWYAYTSFGVFLYSSLLTYFVNYRQILFSASQMEYKITLNYNFVLLIKTLVQIFAMEFLPNPYVWWLILQVVGASAASWQLNRAIKKTFPYLHGSVSEGKKLIKKYAVILTKIKQTVFHAIGGFVLTQSSSLLIFAFVDLRMVAIYGNYMLIANCLRMIFNAAFTGVTAGIGNLVSEGNIEKCMAVFEELFSAKFLAIVTLLVTFYVSVNPFMAIWLGDNFFLENSSILIIVFTMYIILSRTTVDSFISALGLFKDIWSPVAEAILNIGLSISLGYYWGINGVLLGALISLVVIILGWKPYFLFRYGLEVPYKRYFKMYVKHLLAFALSLIVVFPLWKIINLPEPNNYFIWAMKYLLFFAMELIVLAISLYMFTPGMRDFTKRFRVMLRKQ